MKRTRKRTRNAACRNQLDREGSIPFKSGYLPSAQRRIVGETKRNASAS